MTINLPHLPRHPMARNFPKPFGLRKVEGRVYTMAELMAATGASEKGVLSAWHRYAHRPAGRTIANLTAKAREYDATPLTPDP